MYKHTINAAVVFALAVLGGTSAARADSVVKVTLTGENHEKMGMDLSLSSVPAGKVEFDVANGAAKTGHEMILVKLTAKDQTLPLDAAKHRIDEKAVKSLGEVSNLKPGAHGTLKATVAAGDYILICNIKGHYEAGMYAALTVTP